MCIRRFVCLVVRGVALDVVLAQIDESRRAQELAAPGRRARGSREHRAADGGEGKQEQQMEARASRKRAAEGRESDDDARARHCGSVRAEGMAMSR